MKKEDYSWKHEVGKKKTNKKYKEKKIGGKHNAKQ